jgi:hypothetical protein
VILKPKKTIDERDVSFFTADKSADNSQFEENKQENRRTFLK